MPPGVAARRATDPVKMTGKITPTEMSHGEIMTPTELEYSRMCVFMRLSLVGEDMIRCVDGLPNAVKRCQTIITIHWP